MIVTPFAVGLLFVSFSNAFWRLPCTQPVLDARVDPIVTPGTASSHAHTIMGSSAVGYQTTFADLRNSECTTCKVKDDKSAYWIPYLYYQYKNGSFHAVSHGGMLVYYLQRNAPNETVQAFPDGLRMLVGNPFLRSNTGTPESRAMSWNCIDFNGPPEPQTPGFANTHCPDGLRAQVFFPACWDGVNLDSPDHKSHMAYPDGVDSGLCPPSHPIHLVSIFYEVYYNVAPFNALNDGGRFVLANGDPTGYGLHGDFMNGWDRSVLSRAVATCTGSSGVIEDCPVFQNEGRFYTDSENDACAATNPAPHEKVGPGNVLPYLPGCIAVTEGPAPAAAANVAPGCVVGNGSGTSSLPQNASSTSVPLGTSSASAPHSSGGVPAPSSSTLPGTSTAYIPKPSNVSVPTSSSRVFQSLSSTPVIRPMSSPTLASTSSTYDHGHGPVPPPSASQAPYSSHGTYTIPTSVSSPTHTMKPTSTSKASSTAGHVSTAVPPERPVPFPRPGPYKHKHHHHHRPGHHGHVHHHEMEGEHGKDEEYCDEEVPTSPHPASSVLPHRRHHLKRGHGSRMFI